MRIIFTIACLSLSILPSFGAAFPYITLNTHTNRLSDNGTNLTYNGSALAGGAPTYPTITNAMSWSGDTNNVIGGDGRERTVVGGSSIWTNGVPNWPLYDYDGGFTNVTWMLSTDPVPPIQYFPTDVQLANFSGLNFAPYSGTINFSHPDFSDTNFAWQATTTNTYARMGMWDTSLGGFFMQAEAKSGGNAPIFLEALWMDSTNAPSGQLLVQINGHHTDLASGMHDGEAIFGVTDDWGTNIFSVIAIGNSHVSNRQGLIGINQSTPTAVLHISDSTSTNYPVGLKVDSPLTSDLGASISAGSTNAWKLGNVTNGAPNVEVNGTNYTLITSDGSTPIQIIASGYSQSDILTQYGSIPQLTAFGAVLSDTNYTAAGVYATESGSGFNGGTGFNVTMNPDTNTPPTLTGGSVVGIGVFNDVPIITTDTNWDNSAGSNGTIGIVANAGPQGSSSTNGTEYGLFAYSQGTPQYSIGVGALSFPGFTNQTVVGVASTVYTNGKSGTTKMSGYFENGTGIVHPQNAVMVLENRTTGDPLLLARTNGVVVTAINQDGSISVGTSNAWTFGGVSEGGTTNITITINGKTYTLRAN